jgi:FkbM family methyltransferase
VNQVYPAGLNVFPLATPLEGYRMRLEWQSSKALVFGTFEPEVAHLLLQMIHPNWVVLDVGAHIGHFALLLAKLVGPGGKVIAFEPCPENFRTLEENVRMNDCRNVALKNRAVAATTGVMNLRSNDTNQLIFTASLADRQPMIDVETVSLDDYSFRLQEQIRFVMMDIEGAEAPALQRM